MPRPAGARPAEPCRSGYRATSEDELGAIAHREARDSDRACRRRAAAAGIALDEISVGATPTLRFSATQPGVTELRPGNYVYFDRTQVALGAASLDDCALTVLATVVSKPSADRIILDCGSKTLSSDLARGFAAPGYGVVLDDGRSARAIDEALTIERLSEEHATVRVAGGLALEPGDRVRVCRITRASCRTWSTKSGWSTATVSSTRFLSPPGRIT